MVPLGTLFRSRFRKLHLVAYISTDMSNLQLVQLTLWLPPAPDYKGSGSSPSQTSTAVLTLKGLKAGGNDAVLNQVMGNKFMCYDTLAKHSPVSREKQNNSNKNL